MNAKHDSSNKYRIAEVELVYKTNISPAERPKIKSSGDCEDFARPYFQPFIEHHEAFYSLMLNRSHGVLGIHKISEGGISGTVVDLRMIFQSAILCNASAIILMHNHPSGTLRPSPEDERITKKIVKAGTIMDINILDHIIFTADDYYSFADEGNL